MLRVFMVSAGSRLDRIPPTLGGGIQAYEYNLSRKLASLGHEVHILCRWFPDLFENEVLDGVHIHRIKVTEKSDRLSLITFSLRAAKKLSSLITEKDDIVHCHERISGIGVFLFGIQRRAPIIFSAHNWDSLVASRHYFDNWLFYQANLWADMYMIKHSNKVFTISEYMRLDIINRGVPPWKVVTTPNSVDVNQLKPRIFGNRLECGIDNGPLILFVGRLDSEKGLTYLIEAMKLIHRVVPSARLVICGGSKKTNDRYGPHLRKLAQDADNFILFTGRISSEDLMKMYATCDVFVLPSLFEVMPTVVLEAMAFAKPVVATNIPGTNEIIKNRETGFLVKPRNSRALADAIITLLMDTELAEKMGKKGRQVVETSFNWDKAVNKIVQEYEKCL